MLKRDHEILNHCISFDANDKMHVKFSPKLMMRYSDSGSTDSEDDSFDDLREQQPVSSAEDREKEIEELERQHKVRLHMQRTKNAMRWNILRRTMSLDLYWAECQKNSVS